MKNTFLKASVNKLLESTQEMEELFEGVFTSGYLMLLSQFIGFIAGNLSQSDTGTCDVGYFAK